ncbi:MAG: prepilin-type N-terminal cleavage/methylation domain-containing protein [Candidatus Kaiserbacteria bacterium]|nr:prepilin-type N-terminal cleavage/methylation domain-containing protein [Candidatus Kaiserbacteria bacterium]MCB9816824.1 prepilin-type N-terminal cleavage/methylation domain-containing protein [Candidatus Nomurabacteria bacterium]
MQISNTKQSGFTLVEMIVSLAVFSVVVTIAVGALLALITSNERLQNEQSVMTNLSFALDSMTRELRTGFHYFCDAQMAPNAGAHKIFADGINSGITTDLDTELEVGGIPLKQDCATGRGGNTWQGVAFVEGGNSITGAADDRILYFYHEDTGKIYRRVGAGPAQSIVSSGIVITDAEFYVTGSKPLSEGAPDYLDQASITIYIEAREVDDPQAKPYRVQTTVTQRTADV